jgi:hypothetical protein
MPDLLPSLTTLILPRLGQERALEGGIREWLGRGPYSPASSSTNAKVVLENIDPAAFRDYLAFDHGRFALSSYESFRVVSIEASKYELLGWPTLKLYYSAFFAAHAIMRSLGAGVIKLEKKQVDTINEITLVTTGNAIGLVSGMFRYETVVDPAGSQNLVLQPHSGGAGVHDSFWRYFSDFLSALASKAKAAKVADADSFLIGTNDLTARLGSFAPGGSRAWFAEMRNSINYQHDLGVWYPVPDASRRCLTIARLDTISSKLVMLNADLTGNPYTAFVDFSRYLACLNCDIAEWLAARSTKTRAFGSQWRHLKLKMA